MNYKFLKDLAEYGLEFLYEWYFIYFDFFAMMFEKWYEISSFFLKFAPFF